MAYLPFVDESGPDRKRCPYEVLAGVAAEDSRLWTSITRVREASSATEAPIKGGDGDPRRQGLRWGG